MLQNLMIKEPQKSIRVHVLYMYSTVYIQGVTCAANRFYSVSLSSFPQEVYCWFMTWWTYSTRNTNDVLNTQWADLGRVFWYSYLSTLKHMYMQVISLVLWLTGSDQGNDLHALLYK